MLGSTTSFATLGLPYSIDNKRPKQWAGHEEETRRLGSPEIKAVAHAMSYHNQNILLSACDPSCGGM